MCMVACMCFSSVYVYWQRVCVLAACWRRAWSWSSWTSASATSSAGTRWAAGGWHTRASLYRSPADRRCSGGTAGLRGSVGTVTGPGETAEVTRKPSPTTMARVLDLRDYQWHSQLYQYAKKLPVMNMTGQRTSRLGYDIVPYFSRQFCLSSFVTCGACRFPQALVWSYHFPRGPYKG